MTCNIKASKKLSWLIFFLFSPSVFATNGHIYLGGTIGTSEATFGNSNPTINYYDGFLSDAYPIYGNHATTTIIGVNGGYEFAVVGLRPVIALGLGIYGTVGDYDYRGKVIETALEDPSSTLYNYKYHANSTRLMFEAQFAWMLLEKLTPFLNMGIGPAWNRLSGYTESSVDNAGCLALPPPFQSHTNTNFAYQLGLGVGYSFDFIRYISDYQHERISLEYRYVNLGDVSFRKRSADYPYHLDMGRLITNELYLTYTHLF